MVAIKRTLVLCMMIFCASTAFSKVTVGNDFPNFKLATIDGKVLDTSRLAGKVLYVDFWASWCTTCIQSFPLLNELHAELKDQGVVFIGVNTDEDVRLARKFLEKTPVDFIIGLDDTQKVVSYFQPKGFPSAYIVDKQGRVQHIKEGFSSKEETRTMLLTLLNQ